jgi:hypothetical protein
VANSLVSRRESAAVSSTPSIQIEIKQKNENFLVFDFILTKKITKAKRFNYMSN